MKEKYDKIIGWVEDLIINNMTGIIILVIIGIITSKQFCFISIEYTFTSIGATLVFWYGYKKYERDKELEIINNFSLNMYSIDKSSHDMDKLIYDWHILKILHDKGYTKKYVWKEIEQYYIQRINEEIMMSEGWVDMTWEEKYIKINAVENLLTHHSSKEYFKSILLDIFIPIIQKKFDYIDMFEPKRKEEKWSDQRGYFKEIKQIIEQNIIK